MFRSCQKRYGSFSLAKITDPEMFRNTSKIILVGTRNVLGLHKYFRFKRSRKNVFVNSEKHFMGWFPNRFFFQKEITFGERERCVKGGAPPKGAAQNFIHGGGGPWGFLPPHGGYVLHTPLCGIWVKRS